LINECKWKGYWSIKVIDKTTRKVIEEKIIKNKIMNTALDELLKVLQGGETDLEIKYMALGTSNTPVTPNELILGSEIFRTPPIAQVKTGIGELTTTFSVLDNEAVAQIEEIGIFGGSSAGITMNTGKLISRILWSRNKTSNEEIQFTRIDRMVR